MDNTNQTTEQSQSSKVETMTDSHEITKAAPVQIQRESIGMHPLAAAMMANPQMMTPEAMEKMLSLQEKYEAMEAKRAFDDDKIRLMREMPTVISKDKTVAFKGNVAFTHASLPHILKEVEPFLSKHNFSKSWTTKNDKGTITVSCKLTHALGHFEETELSAPPDSSGSKNPVQAVGSTVEYLKRYTLNCLLGITTEDEIDADTKPTSYRIDMKKNLEVLGKLGGVGITKDKAEQFIGRPIAEWTEEDIVDLRGLYKEEKSARETVDAQHEVDAQ